MIILKENFRDTLRKHGIENGEMIFTKKFLRKKMKKSYRQWQNNFLMGNFSRKSYKFVLKNTKVIFFLANFST